MNTFFRRSISEYQRQIGLKESFAIQTRRLRETIESGGWNDYGDLPDDDCRRLRRHLRLLLLFPLIEIAWADGRVTRRESDAIVEVAEAYGFFKDDADYSELLERLTFRPAPQTAAQVWQDFHCLFENLAEFDRQNIAFCLNVQVRFVAEQSSDNLISFLRGERVCQNEQEVLQTVKRRLENALATAEAVEKDQNDVFATEQTADETRQTDALIADFYSDEAELEATLEDYSKLVPLVPLVKTAWAEGRVTKRERHLVFEAARRMGIKPDTAAHRRLAEWLELHPTDEFYDSALGVLQQRWQTLDADEKSRRKFDLLSDCARIAEASGGGKNFPSGGARICNEEIAVVKHIARKLNVASAVQ
jgi:uncharacterized tellurite resistance protein B-like protein